MEEATFEFKSEKARAQFIADKQKDIKRYEKMVEEIKSMLNDLS